MEGNDALSKRVVDYEKKKIGMAAACLLLYLSRAVCTTGNVVILDTEFCVLHALIM